MEILKNYTNEIGPYSVMKDDKLEAITEKSGIPKPAKNKQNILPLAETGAMLPYPKKEISLNLATCDY